MMVTHGSFGDALLVTLRHILGDPPRVEAVPLEMEDSIESLQAKIESALGRVDPEGRGALVLVDMLGGTPFQAAMRTAPGRNVHVLTGLNLPMMIKALSHRGEMDAAALAREVQAGAREAILTSGDLLDKKA